MEQTECSETSAYKIQTPGNYPKESIQHTEHGESLKLRTAISRKAERGTGIDAKSFPPPKVLRIFFLFYKTSCSFLLTQNKGTCCIKQDGASVYNTRSLNTQIVHIVYMYI